MTNTKLALAALPIAALILTGCAGGADTAMKPGESMAPTSMSTPDSMMTEGAMSPSAMAPSAMAPSAMATPGTSMSGDAMMGSSYITYEEYQKSMDAHADSTVVLFFNASWCPDCKAMDAELMKNPMAVPGGVTLVSVDYDGHQDLRQKYGVTMQHTFVQLDKDGNAVTTFSATKVADIAAGLKK